MSKKDYKDRHQRHENYMEETPREETPREEPAKEKVQVRFVVVDTKKLNVRKGPSVLSTIEHVVDSGTVLTVISDQGEWLEVKGYDAKKVGFVMAKFVKAKEA